jgi:hypothetical protein
VGVNAFILVWSGDGDLIGVWCFEFICGVVWEVFTIDVVVGFVIYGFIFVFEIKEIFLGFFLFNIIIIILLGFLIIIIIKISNIKSK